MDNLEIFDIIPVFGGSKTPGALFTVFLLLVGQLPLKCLEKKGSKNLFIFKVVQVANHIAKLIYSACYQCC